MREVRYPAKEIIYNEHGFRSANPKLMARLEQMGIPTLNVVSWMGTMKGALVSFYDAFTEEMVYRWYEPGEAIPRIDLATDEEVGNFLDKVHPQAKAEAKRVIDKVAKSTKVASIDDCEEDDEL